MKQDFRNPKSVENYINATDNFNAIFTESCIKK